MKSKEARGGGGQCADGVCRWLGVPFAELLDGRFASSTPKRELDPTDLATNDSEANGGFGPTCYQFIEGVDIDQSEDCLTLDIWAPQEANDGGSPSLPVMVWIHGGGFLVGSASMGFPSMGLPGDPSVHVYDGARLAGRGVVVVAVQYRLGPFGFLPTSDNATSTGGANGLGDQISALKWVQMHIDRFGGDPSQVTIFGESSGSVSTCALLHSPLTKGLFRRAILQSGSCYPSLDYILTREEAIAVRDDYLQLINGKGDLDLETAPAAEIVRRTMEVYDGNWMKVLQTGVGAPSVDGKILPDLPVRLRPHPGVDILVGDTSFDETVSSIPGGRKEFLSVFGLRGEDAAFVEGAYAFDEDVDLFMDGCIRCQSQRVLERASAGGASGRRYWYSYDCPHNAAPHLSDVFAVFGNIDRTAFASPMIREMFGPPPPPDLIDRVQTAWVSFATSGDPGWADATRTGAGASFGCNATSVRPLVDEFGTCNLWTSAADSVGTLAVGSICMQDAYLSETQPTVEYWNPVTALVAASVCLLCSIYCCVRVRRKEGYSKVDG
ncbi:hypothetical protein ACHAXT_008454 [Thalassiosira profunda]